MIQWFAQPTAAARRVASPETLVRLIRLRAARDRASAPRGAKLQDRAAISPGAALHLNEGENVSLEVGVPIIKQYPVYNFMTALRFNLTF